MYDDEYDDYGYGYGDEEEKEFDGYGDEEEDAYGEDYEFFDPDTAFTVSYRDIGEEGRIGGTQSEMQEYLGLAMGTEIAGGAMAKLQQQLNRQNRDPDMDFRINISMLVKEYGRILNIEEDVIIAKNISKLHLIKYKSPVAYILGYVLSLTLGASKISSTTKRQIDSVLKEHPKITMFEVLKYARWWKQMK